MTFALTLLRNAQDLRNLPVVALCLSGREEGSQWEQGEVSMIGGQVTFICSYEQLSLSHALHCDGGRHIGAGPTADQNVDSKNVDRLSNDSKQNGQDYTVPF